MVYCLFPSGAIGFPALFPRIPGACPQPLSPVLCEDLPLPCGKHGAGAARVFLPGEELAARALERQVECDLLRAEVRSDCHLVAAGRAGKQHQAVGCSFAERVCGLPAAFSGRERRVLVAQPDQCGVEIRKPVMFPRGYGVFLEELEAVVEPHLLSGIPV